ncbi:MAG: hypothetical protein RR887_13355 [Niameybacter sp.]
MSTILDSLQFTNNQRPKYTKYELSRQVIAKRASEDMSIDDFSRKYDVDPQIVEEIEEAQVAFDAEIFNACSKILNKSIREIVAMEEDDLSTMNFRTNSKSKDLMDTVELANTLFHEMIMQQKIRAL